MVSAPFATNNTVTKGTKLPESRTVIRKLSFAPRSRAALSLTIAAQFLRCRRRSSLVTAVRFSNGQEALSLTTAAQNIHVFLRKSPLLKEHFFEWLKTENFSNACGTSTLKSLLPQAFAVSNVHPRPRKRLARCTLDCGFKTPESPALRGFEAERCPITGTSLYLVLKSNGLPHPKIRLKKFGFSPKSVPANIAKKLPTTTLLQTISHRVFNFSHKWLTVAFASKSGYTLAIANRIAHSGLHGETRGVLDGGWYHYPRSVLRGSETLRGRVSERQTLPLLGLGRGHSRRTQRAFGTAMRLCASLFRGVAAPLGCVICLQFGDVAVFSLCAQYFLNVRGGGYHYPRRALHAAETPDGRLQKRLTCRFLVSPIYICERPRRALPLSASIQIACHSISCGQTACPWLMQA